MALGDGFRSFFIVVGSIFPLQWRSDQFSSRIEFPSRIHFRAQEKPLSLTKNGLLVKNNKYSGSFTKFQAFKSHR